MSKHERLDAIERRLAYLEANQAGEDEDRDPRYSCTPQYEPDDDRVIREREEANGIHLRSLADCIRHPERWDLSARSLADVVSPEDADLDYEAALVTEGVVSQRNEWQANRVPDDVRERVSERTSVADATAEHDTWLRTTGLPLEQWDERARRYEASLRALLERSIQSSDPSAADTYALIIGCLEEGGTITPDGLQRAE